NSDGSQDATFRGPVSLSDFPYVRHLSVLADGKILAGGTFSKIGGRSFGGIVQLQPDGSIDDSFQPTPGPDAGGCCPQAYALVPMSNGSLVVSGYFWSVNNGVPRRGLARFRSDGSLD